MAVATKLKHLEDLIAPDPDGRMSDLFFQKCSKNDIPIDEVRAYESSLGQQSPFGGESWWKFYKMIMEQLLQLKSALALADEKESLMSVQQQKTLKSAIEIATVLGIVNNLPKGIGIALKQRSSAGRTVLDEASQSQKCFSLCLTVEILMSLREQPILKDVIVRHQLGDLLAAMFAIFFPPDGFAVPLEFRAKVKKYLETLISKEFQPNVIKELMLLHGNADCPTKVRQAYRGYLTDRLMQKVGAVATIKAILDLTQGLSSPQHWKDVSILSKLITTPHIRNVESYRGKVYPQILQLLYSNELEFLQVAVACVRQIFETSPETCREWFLKPMVTPLLKPSTEDEIARSIEGLHNCCGIPCSENWALPLIAVQEVHGRIFQLHRKVSPSIYHLKTKVADLAMAIIVQCDAKHSYDQFLFPEGNLELEFADNGGVMSKLGEEQVDWEQATDLFLNIIQSTDLAELKYKYFKVALEYIGDFDLEKKLSGAKVLAELSSDENLQEIVSKNPKPIIRFVGNLLKMGGQDAEVVCLGLMVISAMLSNPAHKRTRDWSAFDSLVEPLKEFQTESSNVEVRLLAEELRSTILSHGVISSTKANKVKDVKISSVEEAMKEAVDQLIPVRAHGLMALTKLILMKHKDAESKKDVLMCLFKENLKEDDSYVYLAAIEGLAALATTYPDDAITTLTEQYRYVKSPEIRLKVGEILIKVTRSLNEMAVVYKGELIGAFLAGSLDSDHLVRASSLSNIGELCKILSFRIHAYLTDIFELLSNILQTDKSPEPRRAAVMAVTLLLQGLGKDTFATLQELTLPMLRALKLIVQTDKDDLTKLHAELALQELRSCTINFLMPEPKMEKRIYVMDPLP
ncbi:Hypothetical protein NTJ_01171 [Nesidiocoris tenuis]|uniref:RNA polymerase II assembly factor Rtp1 C-terminal domain-containing protein n=1 Tax=Nesidiocoris tenuis TaxID=355587 RepID=A0ABN7AB68_9HEMI|nr:Hypothetical protein NTJ_01171 [Nesidiocoris tenuis]